MGTYQIKWARVEDPHRVFICKRLSLRVLVARLINATRNGKVIVTSVKRNSP